MKIARRDALLAGLGVLATKRVSAQTALPMVPGGNLAPGFAQPTETIDLWPGKAPGFPNHPPIEVTIERSKNPLRNDRAVVGVTVPRLAVFRPSRPNGASLVIFPGGGYVRMAVDKEGYEIARILIAQGYTVFVLFYRLPGEGWANRADVPLQDAQRAMRIVRAHAGRYGLDRAKVAAMGFSAGGHLCADLMGRFDAPVYHPVDPSDALPARPMIAAPIYPVVSMDPSIAHAGSRVALLGSSPTPEMELAHSPDGHVRADSPPTFLCAAEDDPTVPTENALMLHAALRAAKVAVELHLFGEGGHGFGVYGARGKPIAAWPDLFLTWARRQGWS